MRIAALTAALTLVAGLAHASDPREDTRATCRELYDDVRGYTFCYDLHVAALGELSALLAHHGMTVNEVDVSTPFGKLVEWCLDDMKDMRGAWRYTYVCVQHQIENGVWQ